MVIYIFLFFLVSHFFIQYQIIYLHLYMILVLFLDQMLMKFFKQKKNIIFKLICKIKFNYTKQKKKEKFVFGLEMEIIFHPFHHHKQFLFEIFHIPHRIVIHVECIVYHVFHIVQFVMFVFKILIIIVRGVRQ